MRNKCLSLVTCVAIALTACSALAQGTEPNSFIEKSAPTQQALIKHVQTNEKVMNRYMRHFGMTREEVVVFLSSLVKGKIREDGAYLIYNTPESGEIRARVLFYRKGTPVWMDTAGNYILKVSCGNPMVRGTDFGDTDDPEVIALQAVTGARDLTANPPTLDVNNFTPTSVIPTPPDFDAITIEDMPPVFPIVEDRGQPIIPGLGALIPFTSGILLSSGGSTTPIPEPASLIALSTGAFGLLALRRRKKKLS